MHIFMLVLIYNKLTAGQALALLLHDLDQGINDDIIYTTTIYLFQIVTEVAS